MLQDIRDKSQGWLSWLIVIVIALAFILIGTGSYFATKQEVILAKVNGTEITQTDVDQFYDRYLLQLPAEQASQIDTAAIKKYALDALIQEASIKTSAKNKGFRVSQQQVIQQINQNPSFYEEGKFSPRLYQNLLAQNYFTDKQFREMIEMRVLFQQLQLGLIQSNFTLESDLATLFKYVDQKRDFDYFLVSKDQFINEVNVSEEEARAYYQANPNEFKTQEMVQIEYLELSPEDIKSEVSFTDNDLQGFYKENIKLYSDPEKVRVAHLLVAFDPKDPQAKDEALERVKGYEQEIKSGVGFDTLVEKYSDDPVSAKKGGELYWITQGENSVVEEFEQAAFALKENEISEPVLTPFGYHLIKLLERKEAKVAPFEEVKAKVQDHYQARMAEDLVMEKADNLVSLAYEYSDSLDRAAEETGLKIKTSGYITREPQEGTGIESQPGVIAAAFGFEVLEEGHNSELVEIAENHYLVLRLLEHKKSELKSFEEVQDSIVRALIQKKASELARAQAEKIKESITDLSTLDSVQKETEWKTLKDINRNDLNLPQELVQEAFELPVVEQGNVKAGVVSINGDYAVIALKKVDNGSLEDVDDSRLDQMKENLSINLGQMDLQLFTTHAKEQVEVTKEKK